MGAEWIWYPGEFETQAANRVQARRFEREIPQPPIWQTFGVTPCVKFARAFTLKAPERLKIRASGIFNVELDRPGQFVPVPDGELELSAGPHSLSITVFCGEGKFPALWAEGKTLFTDGEWHCTLQDGRFVRADCGGFSDPEGDPNDWKLPVRRREPDAFEEIEGGRLYDFGKESFGFLCFENARGGGIRLFYGESREEALDFACCEQTDLLTFDRPFVRTPIAKAFRWVAAVGSGGGKYEGFYADMEENPQPFRADFHSDDELLDRIFQVAMDTFGLNTREFFLDGIKRDRWIWSGDATQSYLINKYSFFDLQTERRTMVALCGKGPLTRHFNTITDYTLFWLISFYDHYRWTGDRDFLERWAPRFGEVLDFCLNRRDENGFLISPQGEWVFIDWSPALTKDSEVYAFLQILLFGALRSAAGVCALLDRTKEASRFEEEAAALARQIRRVFWSEEKGGFAHSLLNGTSDGRIFRQTNVMAVMMGLADGRERESILRKVLLDPGIPAVTTPYMRFYEFSALCELGETAKVMREMKAYFKGMLDLGATSFWEYFDPGEQGSEHFAMYGRKYGKSLCHAWGAAPVWLLGRYFLGLLPEDEGYDRFRLCPSPELPEHFSCRFPLKGTEIRIRREGESLCVFAGRSGTAVIGGRTAEIPAGEEVRLLWKNGDPGPDN